MIKIIKSIITFVRRLRNAEHFDFYANILGHLKSKVLKPAALLPLWNALLQQFEREDRIYKRYIRREETKQVKGAHDKRKKAYMALKLVLETGLYSDAAPVEEAAQSLKVVMDNYSTANYAPMTEASAMIANLIQDIEQPMYADSLALLPGAQAAINRLKQDNENFMNLYYNRASGWEGERDEGSMLNARAAVDRDFATLTNAINVYYQANEMQPSKDPEVSATLADVIHSINSYIHQYETIYARRNPKYRPADDQPSLPGGDDQPGSGIPEIAIAAQQILGESVSVSGYGLQMSLRASDPDTFAATLYPIALNGVVMIENPETEAFDSFPVGGFLFDADGTTPTGLLVDVPAQNIFFEKPFMGISDPQQVELLKGDELLAVLLDVKYPATMIASQRV
jgi:hypothetical protein